MGPGQGFTIEEGACIPEHAARCDAFRLLDTTGPLLLPVNVLSRILVTSGDVLHSWSVPAVGVRADACPGRIVEVVVCPRRVGECFGHCSESCGRGHRHMPIHVVVTSAGKVTPSVMSLLDLVVL